MTRPGLLGRLLDGVDAVRARRRQHRAAVAMDPDSWAPTPRDLVLIYVCDALTHLMSYETGRVMREVFTIVTVQAERRAQPVDAIPTARPPRGL